MAKTKLGSNAPFLGGGLGLSIYGDRCAAYSGTLPSYNSVKTALEYTTGKGFIIGSFEFMGGINFVAGNLGDGAIAAFQVSFNGVVIAIIKVDMSLEDMPTKETLEVLIPPLTAVKVENLASATGTSELMTITFTGRIYDA